MHTKGKWELSEIEPGEIWVGADTHIASVHGLREIRAANARLILAAPELLAACKEIADIFPENKMDNLDTADFRDRAMMIFYAAQVAKEAIAKAEEG